MADERLNAENAVAGAILIDPRAFELVVDGRQHRLLPLLPGKIFPGEQMDMGVNLFELFPIHRRLLFVK